MFSLDTGEQYISGVRPGRAVFCNRNRRAERVAVSARSSTISGADSSPAWAGDRRPLIDSLQFMGYSFNAGTPRRS